jgi:hypothetical protein
MQEQVDPIETITEPESQLVDEGMPAGASDNANYDMREAAFSDQDWDDAGPSTDADFYADTELGADAAEPSDMTWTEAKASRRAKRANLLGLLKDKVEQYGLSRRQQLKLAGLVRKEQRERHRASIKSGWDWKASEGEDGAEDVEDGDADQVVDEDVVVVDDGGSPGHAGRHGLRHRHEHDHKKHDKHSKRHGVSELEEAYEGAPDDPESWEDAPAGDDMEGHSRRHRDRHVRKSRHDHREDWKAEHEERINSLYNHRAARKFAHEGHKQVCFSICYCICVWGDCQCNAHTPC